MKTSFLLCVALAISKVPNIVLGNNLVDLNHINNIYSTACIPAVSETIITPYHRTDSVSIPTLKSFVKTTTTPIVENIPYTIHRRVDTPTLPYTLTDTFLSVPAVDAYPSATAGAIQGVVAKTTPKIGVSAGANAGAARASVLIDAGANAAIHVRPLRNAAAAVVTNVPVALTSQGIAQQEICALRTGNIIV